MGRWLVVIDLEATTDDGPEDSRLVPPAEMETIEIGAVLVRTRDFSVEREFQSFVRPLRHPLLTPFCTALTGISQEMVADAPLFPEAMQRLQRSMFAGLDDVSWGSWGQYDQRQLLRDCVLHGLDDPMPQHHNLKHEFSVQQERRKRFGMDAALRLCGLSLEGAHHRALDDAKNITRMLPWILGGSRIGGG